jgi:hypothetical protein
MLITTGLNDPRVAYWEPAKFAAKLREMKTDNNILLLHTNYQAGHAGASGRYDHLKEVAIDYAFLIDRLCYAEHIPETPSHSPEEQVLVTTETYTTLPSALTRGDKEQQVSVS